MSFEQRMQAIKMPDGEYKPTLKDKIVNVLESMDDILYKYVYCDTLEDYKKLPYKDRHIWYFWYLKPHTSNFRDIFRNDSEVNTYLRKKYPIQYFIRNKILARFTYRRMHDWFYRNIECTMFPKQRWLNKDIPKTWTDKVWLIPHVNFTMVLHFVEQENCFETVDYTNSSEIHAKFEKELRECYDYIKFKRAEYEKKIEESYPSAEMSVNASATYEEAYGEVNRLEKELEELDTKWLVWIVENRNFFWA